MGHGHGRHHGHGHSPGAAPIGASAAAAHRGRLLIAAIITAVFLAVEALAAVVTGSLTLLSDVGHMVTDLAGLLLAYVAVTIGPRARRGHTTYGLYRMETLAALANALLLFGVAGYVAFEAVSRLRDPVAVPPGPMLAVAGLGLAVNAVAYLLLRDGAQASLAVRAAATEVFADAIGSAGILLAGAVIAVTGATWVDPAVALLLAALILPRTWLLARQALRVLVQAAPEHVDVAEIERRLSELPAVVGVHDLHVWTLTSGMEVATAHVAVERGTDVQPVLEAAQALLAANYGINHATVQVEPAGNPRCKDVNW